MTENIELKPDFKLLSNYLHLVQENKMALFDEWLLKINGFENSFCSLLEKFKILNHCSNIYYFAGEFKGKIDNLNHNRTFKYFKNVNEYIDQLNKLQELIYSPNKIQSIVLKCNKGGQTINNELLIQEILISISNLPKPNNSKSFEKSKESTFKRIFLKDTQSLYKFIKDYDKSLTRESTVEFIVNLLNLLGFQWEQYSNIDREKHLLNIYKKKRPS